MWLYHPSLLLMLLLTMLVLVENNLGATEITNNSQPHSVTDQGRWKRGPSGYSLLANSPSQSTHNNANSAAGLNWQETAYMPPESPIMSPRQIMQSMLDSFDSQHPEVSTVGPSQQENQTSNYQGDESMKYIEKEEMLNSYIEKLRKKRPFNCLVQNCSTSSNDICTLKKHVNTRHAELIDTQAYENHFNMLHARKPFFCPETDCQNKYNRIDLLKKHILKQHLKHPPPYQTELDQNPVQGDAGTSQLTEKGKFIIDKETKSDQRDKNEKQIKNKEMLNSYIEKLREEGQFHCLCQNCYISTNDITNLKKHVNYKHPELIDTEAYRNHFNILKDKKPFYCPENGCKMKYNYTQNLRTHFLNKHLKQPRPHRTELDQNAVHSDAGTSQLTEKRTSMIDKETSKDQGEESGKYIKNEEKLKSYMEKLREKLPFGCVSKSCPKMFNDKSNLKRHVKCVHPELIGKEAYKNHFKMLKGTKPFSCPESGCDKKYNDTRSLRKHIVKDHLKKPPPHQTNLQQYREKSDVGPSSITNKGKRKKNKV